MYQSTRRPFQPFKLLSKGKRALEPSYQLPKGFRFSFFMSLTGLLMDGAVMNLNYCKYIQ